MQSLDNSSRGGGGGGSSGSFSAMLSSGTDPCFGDHGGHHDFTSLNGTSPVGSNGQTEFGHLMNPTGQSHHLHHHHHHPSHHSETNNNNANTANNNSSKPKKVPPPNGKKTKGRVKIKMEFIDNKLRRYTTFSKRKTGIMKKAYELSTLTGTQVMLLVASETGHVYTFATRKLQPMITSEAGKALIQTCLNSPDPPNTGDAQRMSATGYEETELTYAADPNGSDQGDTKDDDSESSSEGDDSKDLVPVPPLLPLTANGLIPHNFAALLAASSAPTVGFSMVKSSGLNLGLVPSTQDGPTTAGSGSMSNRSRPSAREPMPTTSTSIVVGSTACSSTSSPVSASTAQLNTVSPKSIRIKKEVPN